MRSVVRIAPPNSLVVVLDSSERTIEDPAVFGECSVSGTSNCIFIGTLAAQDGATLIVLTDDERPAGEPVFEGVLNTPGRVVAIYTVLLEAIAECPVPGDVTRISIWTNDPSEPDVVHVFVQSNAQSGGALVPAPR